MKTKKSFKLLILDAITSFFILLDNIYIIYNYTFIFVNFMIQYTIVYYLKI